MKENANEILKQKTDHASKLELAEVEKLLAESRKLNAEAAHFELPWYKKPIIISPLISLLATGLVVLGGFLSGYFDDQQEKLKADRDELKEEIAKLNTRIFESKRDVQHLEQREASLIENNLSSQLLLQATKQEFSRIEREYVNSKNSMELEKKELMNEIARLEKQREGLEGRLQLEAKKQEIVARTLSAGGSISFSSDPKVQGLTLEFSRDSEIDRVVEQAMFSTDPLFPFHVPSGHGDALIGESLVADLGSKDVSKLLEEALEHLDLVSVNFDSDSFDVQRSSLVKLRDSSVRSVRLYGMRCDDTWIEALEGSENLKSIQLNRTSVSSRAVSKLILSCKSLESVDYNSSYVDVAGLMNEQNYSHVRHLLISCNSPLDPGWLKSFTDLTTLVIMNPIKINSVWPESLAKQAKYLSLDAVDQACLINLMNLKNVEILNLRVADLEAIQVLSDLLPRYLNLIELDIDCSYLSFPVESVSTLPKLKSLRIAHTNLAGDRSSLSSLEMLRKLNLHGSPIESSDFAWISRLRNLRELDLSNFHDESNLSPLGKSQIEGGLQGLEQVTWLKSLWLAGNLLSEDAINDLRKMNFLRVLSLSTNGDQEAMRLRLAEDLDQTAIFVTRLPIYDFEAPVPVFEKKILK